MSRATTSCRRSWSISSRSSTTAPCSRCRSPEAAGPPSRRRRRNSSSKPAFGAGVPFGTRHRHPAPSFGTRHRHAAPIIVRVPVTATLITFNEAANIQAALESLSWADEIVVVDSESTDDTVSIARQFTDHVIVRPWPGYVAQKNFAAEQASNEWIFSLDADERVTAALAAEIKAMIERGPRAVGY